MKRSKPIVVGLCGLAGAGKSTAARLLVERYDFVRRPFAYPLKSMLAALGVPREVLDGPAELKELPRDDLCGLTTRHAMQMLGDWGRESMHPDFWVRQWQRGAHLSPRYVADDVRYDNEAAAVRALGGIIIRVERTGAGSVTNPTHSSERNAVASDWQIRNDGTHDDLAWALDRAMARFGLITSASAPLLSATPMPDLAPELLQ